MVGEAVVGTGVVGGGAEEDANGEDGGKGASGWR